MKLRSTAGRKPVVLIAGGGVAALEALLALRDLAGDRIALELVAPGPDFSYRPLAVGEPFGLGEARRYELEGICSDQSARLIQGVIESVEPEHRRAWTADGDELPYDALIIAVGAKASPWLDQALTIYGPGYTGRFSATLRGPRAWAYSGEVTFVVPAGGAWPLPVYELALMTARWVAERDAGGGARARHHARGAAPAALRSRRIRRRRTPARRGSRGSRHVVRSRLDGAGSARTWLPDEMFPSPSGPLSRSPSSRDRRSPGSRSTARGSSRLTTTGWSTGRTTSTPPGTPRPCR